MKNERLPLRTVVQLLFFEQERGSTTTINNITNKLSFQELIPKGKQAPTPRNEQGKLKLGPDHEKPSGTRGEYSIKSTAAVSESGERDNHKIVMKRSEGKVPVELERKSGKGEIEEMEAEKGRDIGKLESRRMNSKGGRSDPGRDKGRER